MKKYLQALLLLSLALTMPCQAADITEQDIVKVEAEALIRPHMRGYEKAFFLGKLYINCTTSEFVVEPNEVRSCIEAVNKMLEVHELIVQEKRNADLMRFAKRYIEANAALTAAWRNARFFNLIQAKLMDRHPSLGIFTVRNRWISI